MRRVPLIGWLIPVCLAAVACGGSEGQDLFGGPVAEGQAGASGTAGSNTAGKATGGGGTSGKGGAAGEAQAGEGGQAGAGATSGASGAGGSAGKGSSGTAGAAGKGSSGSAGSAGKGSSGTAGAAGKGSSGSAGAAGKGSSGSAGSAGSGPDLCAGVSCTQLDGPCVVGTCQPSNGQCVTTPRPKDTPCSDAELCTEGDVCDGKGTCKGTAKDCSGLDGVCVVGYCFASTGACEKSVAPDGTLCDDGDPTTTGDRCEKGQCLGKTSPSPLRLVEVSTGAKDYFAIKNTATDPSQKIDLAGYEIYIDNIKQGGGSSPSFAFTLPARLLAPDETVYVIEESATPKPGDIKIQSNFSIAGGGAGVWLCESSCTTGTIVDAFELGSVLTGLSAPYSFLPKLVLAPQSGDPTFLRIAMLGKSPSFVSTDWKIGQATRTY